MASLKEDGKHAGKEKEGDVVWVGTTKGTSMGTICDWKLLFGRFHDLLIWSCKLAYLRPRTETMAWNPGRNKANWNLYIYIYIYISLNFHISLRSGFCHTILSIVTPYLIWFNSIVLKYPSYILFRIKLILYCYFVIPGLK